MKKTVTKKQFDTFDKQIDLAIIYRGTIIQYFVDLENIIDSILLRYFCSNSIKRKVFRSRILRDRAFNLEFKLRVLKYVIHEKYPDFIKRHTYILADIKRFQELRNDVGHSLVLRTLKGARQFNEKIGNINFDSLVTDNYEIKKPRTITKASFDEIINKMETTRLALLELYNLEKKRRGTKKLSAGG